MNRATEFFGAAWIAQVEELTRVSFPELRQEFHRMAADDALIFDIVKLPAFPTLEAQVFCRPTDAVARLVAAMAAGEGDREVAVFVIHGWPYPVLKRQRPPFDSFAFNQADVQQITARTFSASEIARVYGIAPSELSPAPESPKA